MKDPLGQERRFNDAKKTNSEFIRELVASKNKLWHAEKNLFDKFEAPVEEAGESGAESQTENDYEFQKTAETIFNSSNGD